MNDPASPSAPGDGTGDAARAPVYIGVAWPYANGSLHLGHVAGSLLPPDIFRRYMRMAGHPTLMVSGSDCHGTPILLKAEAEETTPQAIVERYHEQHVAALARLGIGFDLFTRTTTENHTRRVQEIFLAAQEQGLIEKRTQQAPYDAVAKRFLPDRYVEGICPECGYEEARGDQCDDCGKTLDPQDLKSPRSKLDAEHPIEFRDTDHFFFLLSKLQPELEQYVAQNTDHWRANTIHFTRNWLEEGLQDRAITRDLTWGIPIPLDGYDDKRIYVWFEAVCGYLSAAVEWADRASRDHWSGLPDGAANLPAGIPGAARPEDAAAWQAWWTDPDTRAYYFLGKDNIPFHTIIWPAILTAYNKQRQADGRPLLVLPYDVPANEFLNLSGQQFSKSRGITIDVHDVLDRFQADAVRYYLSVIMPEQRDSDWTWDDFLAKVNDELVGNLGNFIHRVLSFTDKNLGAVPDLDLEAVKAAGFDGDGDIHRFGDELATHIGAVKLKRGAETLRSFAAWCNQQIQQVAPWKILKEDRAQGEAAVYHLLRLCKALAVYMAPYMPDAAQRTWTMVGEEGSVHDAAWTDALAPLQAGKKLPAAEALFRKLEPEDLPGGAGPASTGSGSANDGAPASADAGNKPPKAATKEKDTPKETKDVSDTVTIDDFAKLQLRLATIRRVADHPDADKLLVLTLDVGELGERQVVAGLKAHYEAGDLEGQTVAFIANLKPVKLRGVESQGMILAADDGSDVAVLTPQRPLPPGSTIR